MHFAKVLNGKVVRVIVATQEFIDSYVDDSPGEWILTSYNTREGSHEKGGTALRKNFAGIGHSYDRAADEFIPPKPYDSWIRDSVKGNWKAPISKPATGNTEWDEVSQQWIDR